MARRLPFSVSASNKSDNYLFRFHPDSLSTTNEEELQCETDTEKKGEGKAGAVINSGEN